MTEIATGVPIYAVTLSDSERARREGGQVMTAIEELRELLAVKQGVEARISDCLTYLSNESRWRTELDREEKKLLWQQERVDRLRRMRGEVGNARLESLRSQLSNVNSRQLEVKNRAAIEKMIRLQRELDELNSGTGSSVAEQSALAACDVEVLTFLVCDACGHVTQGYHDDVSSCCLVDRCGGVYEERE